MIKISNRSQYGLRAMVYLAQRKTTCSLRKISGDEKISLAFLEKIFAKLKKSGLVKVKRGARGGYILAKSANSISVAEIVKPLEGKIALAFCLDQQRKCACPIERKCLTKNVWVKVQDAINKSLESISLKDLLNVKY